MTARPLISRRLSPPSAADADLLRAYAATADADALAELAGRYAGLARRAAADVYPPAADDAAQVALVLLGRKAAAVAAGGSPAGWVFETARRLALKARTAAARRARQEARATARRPATDPLDALTLREVRAAVAEEVARLPDALRGPLVLYYWDGESRASAAARAGCSESTLRRRLDEGRDRLAARLAARGFAGPAVLAALTALQAGGRAPAAPAVAAAVGGGGLTPGAAGLLRATGQGVAARWLAAAALVVGTGLAVGVAAEGLRVPPAPVPQARPPAAETLDAHGDPLPPGAVARLGTTRFRLGMWPKTLAASPDGTQLVSVGHNLPRNNHLTVWNSATGRAARQVAVPGAVVEGAHWLPGGRGFAVVKVSVADYAVWEFTDPAVAAPTPVRPDEMNADGNGSFTASAVSPDGTLIVGGQRAGDEGNLGRLTAWELTPNGRVREMKARHTADFDGPVVALHFTPDSRRLAVVTRKKEPDRPDLTVRAGPIPLVMGAYADTARVSVRATDTGAEVKAFDVHAGVTCLSPDGGTLYVGGQAGKVVAFDLAAGTPGRTFEAGEAPGGLLAVSANGKTLVASRTQSCLTAFDTATGKERWRTTDRDSQWVHALTALPDGRFAAATATGTVLLLDPATGRVTNGQSGPREWVTSVAVEDGGRTAVTCENEGIFRRWELATGRETGQTAITGTVGFWGRAFSPNGRTVVGFGEVDKERVFGVVDVATGRLTTRLPLDPQALRLVPTSYNQPAAWLPDGSVVVAGGGDAAVRFGPDGREVRRYGPTADSVEVGGQVTVVAVRPDGQEVLLAGEGGPSGGRRGPAWVTVYDAATGAVRSRHKPGGRLAAAAYTPDGSVALLAGGVSQPPRPVEQPPAELDLSAAVLRLDTVRRELTHPFAAPDPALPYRSAMCMAVSPAGGLFAVAEADHTLTVYETASRSIHRRLPGHRNAVTQLAFTPDGRRLVSVSADGTGLVWDVARPVAGH